MIQTIIDNLLKLLPHNYSKNPNSNIDKLVALIREQLTEINDKRLLFKKAQDIDQAEGELLDLIGQSIGQERGQFDDQIYRLLIKSRIRQNLSPGDINSIIEYIATLFQIPRENIQIDESEWGSFRFSSVNGTVQTSEYEGFGTGVLAADNPEPAFYRFNITPESLNSIGFPVQDLVTIVKNLSAAGVRISFFVEGTFAFSATNGEVEYSEEKGFDYGTLGAYYNPDEGYFS